MPPSAQVTRCWPRVPVTVWFCMLGRSLNRSSSVPAFPGHGSDGTAAPRPQGMTSVCVSCCLPWPRLGVQLPCPGSCAFWNSATQGQGCDGFHPEPEPRVSESRDERPRRSLSVLVSEEKHPSALLFLLLCLPPGCPVVSRCDPGEGNVDLGIGTSACHGLAAGWQAGCELASYLSKSPEAVERSCQAHGTPAGRTQWSLAALQGVKGSEESCVTC